MYVIFNTKIWGLDVIQNYSEAYLKTRDEISSLMWSNSALSFIL